MATNHKYASSIPNESVLKEGKTNVIIQCPKCETKFSVSSELISELELPRFHCSRCDNVFDMDPRTSASFEESDIEAASEAITNTSESIPTDITPEPYVEPEPIAASGTMEISKETISQLNSMLAAEKAKEVKIEPQPQEQKDTLRSLQIPSTYSPAKPASAPIEKITDTSGDQLTMNLGLESQAKTTTDFTMPYGISIGKSFEKPLTSVDKLESSSDYTEEDLSRYEPQTEPEEEEQPIERLPRMSAPLMSGASASNRWSGPGIIIMPIVLTLFIAALMSFALVRSPNLAEALATNLGVPLEKFPPAGLYLEAIKYNNHILDNGEKIAVISGKIRNDSPTKLKEVTLEGFAFDKNGDILDSVKISAGSNLNDAKIKSFSIEEIRNMQKAKASKKFEISPNSEMEFIIPFSDPEQVDLSKADFFSARIYSVTM